MTPTIPELVARLRERLALYEIYCLDGDEAGAAELRSEVMPLLPTLLDALERGQEDSPGVSFLRQVASNLRLRGGTITFTAQQLETVLAGLGAPLDSRSTWRPITQVPTAEEHAWCGGRYLIDEGDGHLNVTTQSHEQIVLLLPKWTWAVAWLPIPPSAGGSEEG